MLSRQSLIYHWRSSACSCFSSAVSSVSLDFFASWFILATFSSISVIAISFLSKKTNNAVFEFQWLHILGRQPKPERYLCRWLPQSYLVAHNCDCLVLLYSYPDTVHRQSLHKTLLSTLLAHSSFPQRRPSKAFSPTVVDCGQQGTTSSPPSAVLRL